MDIQGHIIDHWVEKMLDHLAKLADVRCLSSEEQEKYDESIKAVDDYYSGLYGSYVEGEAGFEKWIYVLKYMEVLERLPFTIQKKIFDHLACFEIIMYLCSQKSNNN